MNLYIYIYLYKNNDNTIKKELKKLDLFSYSTFFLEMKNKLDMNNLYKSFIVDILTIPAIRNRFFDVKGLINFASHLQFVSLLEYINTNFDDIAYYIDNEANIYPNNNLFVNLLSNIVAFGKSLILKGTTSFAVNLLDYYNNNSFK